MTTSTDFLPAKKKKTAYMPPSPENIAIDLESFANHASRQNVTTEDVLLLARKNPDLQQIMGDFVQERKDIKMARGRAGRSIRGRR